jgi:plastocyanin
MAAPAGVAKSKKSKSKPVTIGVFDNYYAPIPKKALKLGTTVRWKWDASSLDVHDVRVKKAPKGFRKFQTDPLSAGSSFKRKLTKPGKYYFICTFHEDMTMKLTVAKKK